MWSSMRRIVTSVVLALAALALASGPVAAADGPCCYDTGSVQLAG